MATVSFSVEVFQEPTPACKEIGRTTRAYVSAYSLSNVHQTRVRRRTKRCIIANFNGALPAGVGITKVTWRTNHPWVCHISNPSLVPLVTGGPLRQAQVTCDFDNPGIGSLKAEITTDTGEIYVQLFEFSVWDSPLFDEPFNPNTGPYNITATA